MGYRSDSITVSRDMGPLRPPPPPSNEHAALPSKPKQEPPSAGRGGAGAAYGKEVSRSATYHFMIEGLLGSDLTFDQDAKLQLRHLMLRSIVSSGHCR